MAVAGLSEFSFRDGTGLDAYGRQRVSSNHTLFSGQLNHAENPLVWDKLATGGGSTAYLVDESTLNLVVDGTNGARAVSQSKRYWLYRSGQSQEVKFSLADATQIANVTKQSGYFDDDDGIFLRVTGGDIALIRRTSTSGSSVDADVKLRNDWSIDSLDGSGPSGLTLDFDNAIHGRIDLQWLGVGRVRVDFMVDGQYRHAHWFDFSNSLTVPYMKLASLPVRYEIFNTAASAGANLKQICANVNREGGDEEEGIPTAVRSPLSAGVLTATTTPRSSISIRLRDSHVRAFAKPRLVELLNMGTGAVAFDLILNPTLTGSLTWVNTGQAGLQRSFTQLNYTASSGHCIASGGTNSTNQSRGTHQSEIEASIGIAADIGGTADILSLIVEAATGPDNILASIRMLELF